MYQMYLNVTNRFFNNNNEKNHYSGACFLSLKNNVESALSKCGDSLLSNCIFNSDEKKKQPKRAWLTHFFFSPLWWLFTAKTHRRFPLPLRTSRSSKSTCCSTRHSPRPPPIALSFLIDRSYVPPPALLTPPSSLPDQWGLRSEDEPSRAASRLVGSAGVCAP